MEKEKLNKEEEIKKPYPSRGKCSCGRSIFLSLLIFFILCLFIVTCPSVKKPLFSLFSPTMNASASNEVSSLMLVVFNTNSVIIYDSKENDWKKCQMKLPYTFLGQGIIILNDALYFFGFDNTYLILTETYRLNLGEDNWLQLANMTDKRSSISGSSIVFNSEIWAIGGYTNTDFFFRKSLKTVEKFNPQTNTWIKMPDLNEERGEAEAAILDGKLYVSGGHFVSEGWKNKEYRRIKSIEVYDPAINKWEIFCDMPADLNSHSLIAEGTNLIIFEAWNSEMEVSNVVWKLDVLDPKKEWKPMPSIPIPLLKSRAIKLASGIMVVDGFGFVTASSWSRILNSTIFDGQKWIEGPMLPELPKGFNIVPLLRKNEEMLLQELSCA